jgi:N-acetylneuraminic acid mutarotase
VLNKGKVIIFGGFGSDDKASTLIEIFDTKTKEINKAEYRLPLGVSGSRMAWHGSDIILIGGERLGKRSNHVVKLDFEEKSILSLREMGSKRTSTIAIEVAHDEIIVIGGNTKEATAEIRKWNRYLEDYS